MKNTLFQCAHIIFNALVHPTQLRIQRITLEAIVWEEPGLCGHCLYNTECALDVWAWQQSFWEGMWHSSNN